MIKPSETEFNAIKEEVLDNGVHMYFYRVAGELVHVRFGYMVGGFYEKPEQAGISHLIEHLCMSANPEKTCIQFSEQMNSLGATLNASTSTDFTRFYFSSLGIHAAEAFKIYHDQFAKFEINSQILEKEKKVVCQEIDSYEDNSWDVLFRGIMAGAFPKHPVSTPLIGFTETVNKQTVASVEEYVHTHYVPSAMRVIIVGDLPDDQMEKIHGILEEIPASLESEKYMIPPRATEVFNKRIFIPKKGQTQYLVSQYYPFSWKYMKEALIAQYLLGGPLGSYLWNEFREKRSLAYIIGANLTGLDPANPVLHYYAGLTNKEDLEPAYYIFTNSQSYLKTVTEEKYNQWKEFAITQILLGMQKLSDVAWSIEDNINYDCPLSVSYMHDLLKESNYGDFLEFANIFMDIDPVRGTLYPEVSNGGFC